MERSVNIFVLNWNGKKIINECLHSLMKISYTNSKIIVIDNGSKDDSVSFISKENLKINGNNLAVDHFKLKSTDSNLEADKRLDFDIWYDSKNNIIVKVEYKRLGKWQYILKKIE